MASTFTLYKAYGPLSSDEASTSFMHLINQSVAPASSDYTVSANQITVPSSGNVFSYELYVRAKWTGTYTNISNFKFWKSAGPAPTGVTWKYGRTATFTTPVATSSSVATGSLPTADTDASAAVTVNSPTSSAISDYVVVQLQVASTAGPGDVGDTTYSMKWTEA